MEAFIHEKSEWPGFNWDQEGLTNQLATVRYKQGRLIGRMQALGFQLREEAVLSTLTQDVLKTSEIEGEILNIDQVRSSLASRLGVDIGGPKVADRHVDGVVEMMLDATQHYRDPLTEERLFGWHAALFPAGRKGIQKINVGAWRNDSAGPMRVISGAIGREQIHYQAPKAELLSMEMLKFLNWFNGNHSVDPVLKAALSHLWFVTIHPFDDGNGRIARAIADLALARSENSPKRFYSMSAQIRLERSEYYNILESTQKGTLNVTPWMKWFLECLERAFEGVDTVLASVLRKGLFWEAHLGAHFNERQQKVINRLLDGFEGKLSSSKWAKLAKCSQDTAHRDIVELVERGILVRETAGGRSTSYSLTVPKKENEQF